MSITMTKMMVVRNKSSILNAVQARGPGQKGISKVNSNDLTQLGLIQTAEDQKTRDNGKDDHRSVNYI